MSECPRCKSIIVFPPGYLDKQVCPTCGAVLARSRGVGGLFGGLKVVGDTRSSSSYSTESGEVALTEAEAQDKWRRDHPEYYSESPQRRAFNEAQRQKKSGALIKRSTSTTDKAATRRCENCHSAISTVNAKFCANCGASLKIPGASAQLSRRKAKLRTKKPVLPSAKQIGKCMVCNLELSPRENVVWCPHCGNLAHRNHLMEWLHIERRCPACGKSLFESDYS